MRALFCFPPYTYWRNDLCTAYGLLWPSRARNLAACLFVTRVATMYTQVGEMSRQLAEAAERFAAVSADRQRLVDALRRADDSGCNDGDNDGERSGLSTTAEVAEGAEGKA